MGALARIPRIAVLIVLLACFAAGQTKTYERRFHDSAGNIKKVLQQMQPAMAGHLPVLDGFAVPASHPLNLYERGYYQASTQVMANAGGDNIVRITVKVTAWYSDPDGSHPGYQLLPSNGRIEADILDQLSEKLAALKAAPAEDAEATSPVKSAPVKDDSNLVSAPDPQTPMFPRSSSSLSQSIGSAPSEAADPAAGKTSNIEQSQLEAELQQLQQVLKNQAHPKNLVAVKKSGTPVVANPRLNAKPLFLASAHDEFEMLNFNQDWVHVQISGLSRGWIWRNALEMPGDVPDTQAESRGSAADLFRVAREETAPFPGDWAPLRGKTVMLLSVQKVDENSKDAGPDMKLEFAKSLLEKSFAEIAAQKSLNVSGVVLIFDSADGGMVAVPGPILARWKAGELSDAALWHASFFDPPETFITSNTPTR